MRTYKNGCQVIEHKTKKGTIQLLPIVDYKLGTKPSFRHKGNSKLQQEGEYSILTFSRLGQATLNMLLKDGYKKPSAIPNEVCFNCDKCKDFCYNLKGYWRDNITNNRISNYLWTLDPNFITLADKQIKAHIKRAQRQNKKPATRIHVEGEFTTTEYFLTWCKLARDNKDMQFYSYTKNYDLMIDNSQYIPQNLNIMVSSWDGQSKEEQQKIKQLQDIGFKIYHARAKGENIKSTTHDCKFNCSACNNCVVGKKNASVEIH